MRYALLGSAIAVSWFLPLSSVAGATWIVDSTGAGDRTEIQSVLDEAADGDEVLVRPGEYLLAEPLSFNRLRDPYSPEPGPAKNLTLRSTGGPAVTTIRMSLEPLSEGRASVVIFENGEGPASVVEGFRLVGGKGSYPMGSEKKWGGGILCANGSSPRVENCVISGNWRGGVACDFGSALALDRCTVAGNHDGGLCLLAGGSAELSSTIVWDNAGGSVSSPTAILDALQVRRSCLEGDEPPPGEGNRNEDPLFCGWPAQEVHVDASQAGPGNGSEASPYRDLAPALDSFSLSLSVGSPCVGTAEGGGDMGADLGTCAERGPQKALLLLRPGTYEVAGRSLVHGASLRGSGREATEVRGTVFGLRTGAILSALSVVEGTEGGVVIDAGEAPEIRDVAIDANRSRRDGAGVYSGPGSAPVIAGCVISRNRTEGSGGGVYCALGSTLTLLDSEISGNHADDEDGGGVVCGAGSIRGCAIVGNSATDDGGGVLLYGTAELDDCLIGGNLPSGLECWDGAAPSITRCTIVGNRKGGLLAFNSSHPTLRSSIIWGNGDASISTSQDARVEASHSSIATGAEPWEGEGNIAFDPSFCSPGSWDDSGTPEIWDDLWVPGDFRLRADSPCLGSGEEGQDMGAALGLCGGTAFRRGDANSDEQTDLSDAVFVLSYLFLGGEAPSCLQSADTDAGGQLEITDGVYLLNFLFLGGPEPPAPFPDCGQGDALTSLTCIRYPGCEAVGR